MDPVISEEEMEVWTRLFCAALTGMAAHKDTGANPAEQLAADARELADTALLLWSHRQTLTLDGFRVLLPVLRRPEET